jgi:hypothetical protein
VKKKEKERKKEKHQLTFLYFISVDSPFSITLLQERKKPTSKSRDTIKINFYSANAYIKKEGWNEKQAIL